MRGGEGEEEEREARWRLLFRLLELASTAGCCDLVYEAVRELAQASGGWMTRLRQGKEEGEMRRQLKECGDGKGGVGVEGVAMSSSPFCVCSMSSQSEEKRRKRGSTSPESLVETLASFLVTPLPRIHSLVAPPSPSTTRPHLPPDSRDPPPPPRPPHRPLDTRLSYSTKLTEYATAAFSILCHHGQRRFGSHSQ